MRLSRQEGAARVFDDDGRFGEVEADDLLGHDADGTGVLAVDDEGNRVHVAVLAVADLDVQYAGQGPQFKFEVFFCR